MATPVLVRVAKNHEMISTNQGMAVALPVAAGAGDALIAIVFGARQEGPFAAKNLTTNTPDPVFTPSSGWTTFTANQSKLVNVGTITGTGTSGQESIPDLDGYFPSIYVAYKPNAGGVSSVNIKNCYAGATVKGTADANGHIGETVFNGGVSAILMDFSGVKTTTQPDATPVVSLSTANPATNAGFTTGTAGDLILAIGLAKNGNNFAAASGWTVATQGKLIGGQEHYIVAYKVQVSAGAITPAFTNPQRLQVAVFQLALKAA